MIRLPSRSALPLRPAAAGACAGQPRSWRQRLARSAVVLSRSAVVLSRSAVVLPRTAVVFLALFCVMLADANVQADGYDDRRVRAGARLFRSLLAADITPPAQATANGEALQIIVLGGDKPLQSELAALLTPADDTDKSRLRGLPLVIEFREQLPEEFSTRPAGIFLATPPPAKELDRLIRWSITHRVILYSPFEGHVERGVTAGISIEAKVQPYLNAGTLEAAGLAFKPFFMKVARVHR